MTNLSLDLRSKLNIVEPKFFIEQFHELARGTDEAYAVITQAYPQLFIPLLKQQIETGCQIIEEGHAREALLEIKDDIMQEESIRYNATVLYNELEEDGLLEAPEYEFHGYISLSDEELLSPEEFRYYIGEDEPSAEFRVNFSNESTMESITDLLQLESSATISRMVEKIGKNEYSIKSSLIDLMDKGLVNCLEGQFSLAIGYELKDNFIFKLAHSVSQTDSGFFFDEALLADDLWDDDEDLPFLVDCDDTNLEA